MNDLDLRVIRDLGTIGRSKAMTKGIIVAMKALTVAMVVNNSSNEGQVMAEALGKERETLLAMVSQLGRIHPRLRRSLMIGLPS